MAEYYYNVENTDNPYILLYAQSKLETLSDRFVIKDKEIYFYDNVAYTNNHNAGIVDIDLVRSVLISYKEQLLLDKKKKTILDYAFTHKGLRWGCQGLFNDLGLVCGKGDSSSVSPPVLPPTRSTSVWKTL